ncbi:hypothetical protein ACFFV7_31885 [Nonomuraea spiralis]|uniref:Transposase n=1 Tax=Nonomuraea spiralis TaxID=46182 RepID=A0ABV5IMQ9_9ACTN|nr:hypothetical protein [Nonomuraea spiralis]
MDLDEVAGRLYAIPPAEFTAARAAEVRAAKDAGDVRLSREIAKLRKPTVSAWAVNRLAREHPQELAELLALGERLRAAWQEQDAGALAGLTRRRGEVTAKVARLARQGGGLSAAAASEVDQTLDAAVVDADAAGQVRAGRLAKPLSYSGFAPAPVTAARPAPRGRTSSPRKTADAEAESKARAEAEAKEARRAREREEAEAAHREWARALESVTREYDERADRVARLEGKLAKARKKLEEARQRLEVTRREERHARQRLS